MKYLKKDFFLNTDIINLIDSFYPKDKDFRSETSYVMYDIIADYNIHKHFVMNISFSDYFFHCTYPLKWSGTRCSTKPTGQLIYMASYELYWKPINKQYEFENIL